MQNAPGFQRSTYPSLYHMDSAGPVELWERMTHYRTPPPSALPSYAVVSPQRPTPRPSKLDTGEERRRRRRRPQVGGVGGMATLRLFRTACACLTMCPFVMCGGDGRVLARVSIVRCIFFSDYAFHNLQLVVGHARCCCLPGLVTGGTVSRRPLPARKPPKIAL